MPFKRRFGKMITPGLAAFLVAGAIDRVNQGIEMSPISARDPDLNSGLMEML
jgi:hypothetical protein